MIQATRRVASLERKYSPKRNRIGTIRLDLNENVVGWPREAVARMSATLTSEILAAYPEAEELQEEIARHHGLTPAHLMVTSGSELAIRYIFEAFLGAGDELVVLSPSFAMFEVYAKLMEATVVGIPFGAGLQVSADRIIEAISARTRVVAIANPNNPTGTVFTERELVAIEERAAAVGAVCLVDEAYYYFYKKTMMHRVSSSENLIVTRTFSKAWGLAGVRLGYAAGPPALIELAQRAQPIDHVNVLAVAAGRYALGHEDQVWQYAEAVGRGREVIAQALARMNVPVIAGEGNFVLADFGDRRESVVEVLRANGVLLGTTLRLPGHPTLLRFTVGPPEIMLEVVELLQECFE